MWGVLFVIAACFVWAFDSLIRYPLMGEGVGAYRIVLLEHLVLSTIFAYFFLKRLREVQAKNLIYFLFVGGVGSALATLAFTSAFQYLNPSVVIILQKLQPVVAIILAKLFLGEELKSEFVFWAIICLFGGALIGYKDMEKLLSGGLGAFDSNALKGYLLVTFSVIGWGVSTVLGKKLTLEGFSTKEIVGGRALFGLVCLAPFLLEIEYEKALTGFQVGKIALMALFSGAIGLYLYYQGLMRIPARLCALVEMFYPVGAIVANWIFLGFGISLLEAIGAMILMGGSAMIQIKKF